MNKSERRSLIDRCDQICNEIEDAIIGFAEQYDRDPEYIYIDEERKKVLDSVLSDGYLPTIAGMPGTAQYKGCNVVATTEPNFLRVSA